MPTNTINNSLSNTLNSTPNDVIIEVLPTISYSSLFSDSNIFWIFTIGIFSILYLILGRFDTIKKSTRTLFALSIPILIDLFISFGTFTFTFPFSYSFTVSHGVMFLKLLDYLFSYGLYNDYSSSLISPFIQNASPVASSTLTYLLLFLINSIDTILEFIFLSYLTYTLITIIENSTHKQINYQLPISIAIGFIPVFFYMIFVSNPIEETAKTIINLNATIDFFASSSLLTIALMAFFIILNFVIISQIIFIVVELCFTLYSNLNYSKAGIEWLYSKHGIALSFSIVYSLIFMLHSDFKWYSVFPILLLYSYFKDKSSTYIKNSKTNQFETQRIQDISRSTIEQYNPSSHPHPFSEPDQIHDEFSLYNIILSILVIIILVLSYYWYTLQ